LKCNKFDDEILRNVSMDCSSSVLLADLRQSGGLVGHLLLKQFTAQPSLLSHLDEIPENLWNGRMPRKLKHNIGSVGGWAKYLLGRGA
jgi:hypothetical protein